MSSTAFVAVLDYSQSEKVDRLVMLMLADNAGLDGVSYASIERLAESTRLKPKEVEASLSRLVAMGEVARISMEGIGGEERFGHIILLPGLLTENLEAHPTIIEGGALAALERAA